MKPLIGITMNLEEQSTRDLNILDPDYGRAVLQAGGIPVPILGIETSVPDIIGRFDGFVFTGGDDIDPGFYREHSLVGAKITLSPDKRTQFEIRLLKAVMKAKKPVLAICHGAQLVNVALGGALFQDIALQIPKAIRHGAMKKGGKVFHPVALFEGTLLQRIMGVGSIPRVRSGHHQSARNPGRGLQLAAVARDGVIEALEWRNSQFLIAVQWHPEKTLNDKYTKKLFKALVDASKK